MDSDEVIGISLFAGILGAIAWAASSSSNSSNTNNMAALAFLNSYPGTDKDVFANAIVAMCQRLGINPNWLMFVMWNETCHTFSPNIQAGSCKPNQPFNDKRATGLIQFEPDTAIGLGTTTQALYNMTALEQLPYVEKFLQQQIGAVGVPTNITDMYLLVFYPAGVGQGPTFAFPGTVVADNPEFFAGKTGTTQDITDWINETIPAEYANLFADNASS